MLYYFKNKLVNSLTENSIVVSFPFYNVLTINGYNEMRRKVKYLPVN